MDDYELQQELESMAHALSFSSAEDQAGIHLEETVSRWQNLFKLEEGDALDRIVRHRNDLSRLIVSDAHWDAVRQAKEEAGYDREAFEYELNLQKNKAMLTQDLAASANPDAESLKYLVEFRKPFETIEQLCSIAELESQPSIVRGRSFETREDVQLCCIDDKARVRLVQWAAAEGHVLTILVDPRSMKV